MNELFIKLGQTKTEIDGLISSIYDTPSKSAKFDNINAINSEISSLNEKADVIRQKISKMNSDIISLRQMVNTSTKIENTTIWRK